MMLLKLHSDYEPPCLGEGGGVPKRTYSLNIYIYSPLKMVYLTK
jgi:hypothetical protein